MLKNCLFPWFVYFEASARTFLQGKGISNVFQTVWQFLNWHYRKHLCFSAIQYMTTKASVSHSATWALLSPSQSHNFSLNDCHLISIQYHKLQCAYQPFTLLETQVAQAQYASVIIDIHCKSSTLIKKTVSVKSKVKVIVVWFQLIFVSTAEL